MVKLESLKKSDQFKKTLKEKKVHSEYYIESLRTYGFIKGSVMGIKRIFSCHPFKVLGGGSGLDLVPNKKNLTKEKLNG